MEENHQEDVDVGGRIILRCKLERWNREVCTGLMKLRMVTTGELL
jgi:hypothetical protein